MQRPATHPRTKARGTRPGAEVAVRTIVYSPAQERARFIEYDLSRAPVIVEVARGIREVVSALVDQPPPRPQILVIDLDLLPAGELLHLHTVRDEGWCGTIIALGRVPASIRKSLNIATVIALPLVEDALRDALAPSRFDAQTIRCPVIED